jgi:hypothetical protein
VTGTKTFTLTATMLASDGLSAYNDQAKHSGKVTVANGWPAEGLLTGYRYGSEGAQQLQVAGTGNTFSRYWTGAAWSSWALYGGSTSGATGTVLGPDPEAASGLSYRMSPFSSGGISTKKVMASYAFPGGTTQNQFGMPALTLNATVSNADDTAGPWLLHTSGAVSGNNTGPVGSAMTRRDWLGECYMRIKLGSAVTTARNWVGLFSGDPTGSATPSLHLAAFRYDTGTDGTAFWRCITAAGSATQTTTTTTVAVAANGVHDMAIVLSASDVKFYIANLLVGTHTTNLPTATQLLTPRIHVTTLAVATRAIAWSKVELRTW